MRFALQTGWRRSEVFACTWGQVDWNGGFVPLEPGTAKSGEGRAFPITPALRRLLERRQEYTRRGERAQARIIRSSSITRAVPRSQIEGDGYVILAIIPHPK